MLVLVVESKTGGSDMPSFIAMLEESRATIPKAIGQSHRTLTDQVPTERIGVVRDAYESLEKFLLQLSTTGGP